MHHIYVIQQNGEKSFWNRAGVAFKNNDGSFNLKLDLFPGVQLQLREAKNDAVEPAPKETGNARHNTNRR